MRDLVWALGAALAFCACGDRPRPAEPGPAPAPAQAGAAPRAVASFVATIVPPSRGPGMGQAPGEAVFTVLPEGRDGQARTNPARTIEIVGTGFVWNPIYGGSIQAPVRITNYLPERLVDLHVAFTINDSEHQLNVQGSQPIGADILGTSSSKSVYFDAPPAGAGPSGYLNYVVPDQFPRNALAGSPVDDGSAPGGVASVSWVFAFPVEEAPPFTLRGDVWADLYPARPSASPRTLSALEPGMTVIWYVEDVKDRVATGWPVTGAQRVGYADARACGVAFGVEGTCPAAETHGFTSMVQQGTLIASPAQWPLYAYFSAAPPDSLVPGRTYHLDIRNVWDQDGNAATPMVRGSLPLARTFVAVGRPTPVAATPAPAAFAWTVDHPLVTAPAAGRPVLQVCAHSDCQIYQADRTDPILSVDAAWSSVESPPGSATWTFTVDPAVVQAALDAHDPTRTTRYYWWTVRNLHEDEEGPWLTPVSFLYPPQ